MSVTRVNLRQVKFAEVKLPKVVRKKMDPLVNDEDDYAILDKLLAVGKATHTLAVSLITLAVSETDKVVYLEMSQQSYLLDEQTEELPLSQVLRAKKSRIVAFSHSGVTVTGKRIVENIILEGQPGKRSRNVNVPGKKDGDVTFEGVAPTTLELPRVKLNHVLE